EASNRLLLAQSNVFHSSSSAQRPPVRAPPPPPPPLQYSTLAPRHITHPAHQYKTPPPPSPAAHRETKSPPNPRIKRHEAFSSEHSRGSQRRAMAVGFRRALDALTSPKSALLECARPKKLSSYARVRSISLPVRLHPLVAALHDSARALLRWADEPAQTGPAWVADGADRAGQVLAGLSAMLHHPQARDALRRPWTEQLLDDLLLLADFHGCFRDSLVALRQLLNETHSA
uniref:Uncharacterized protein n=1 Tax=Aegilops tauschii subsp. strangulata TaxID=200361 RepID=A0A452YSG7_AEGTS